MSSERPTGDILEKDRRFKNIYVDQPCVLKSIHDELPTDDSKDVEAIRIACLDAFEQDSDVVLVSHSSGSILACNAAEGLSARDRTGKGIIAMAFISALLPMDKATLREYFGGRPWTLADQVAPGVSVLNENGFKSMLPDLSEEDFKKYSAVFRPQAQIPQMETPIRYEAYRDIFSSFIATVLDAKAPPELMRKALNDSGYQFDYVEELPAHHFCTVSHPNETAACLANTARLALQELAARPS